MSTSWRGRWLRLRALVAPRAAERDLDEEMRFHLEQETARWRREGLPAADARQRALASFGGVEVTKEALRDGRGGRPLHDAGRDVRYGLRLFRRQPLLSGTVLLVLSLGIGASVAVFTAVNAVLLRPMPFPTPERLVALWESNSLKGWVQETAAPANMLDWEAQVPALDGVAAWVPFDDEVSVVTGDRATSLAVTGVTGGFFSVLGVAPMLGRGFEARETWETATRVTVLSHATWRDHFASDATIIGRTVRVDGRDVEVVGVMGPDFAFPSASTDLWVPTRWEPASREQDWFRRAHFVRPFARLRAGATVEQLNAQLEGVMRQLETRHPVINEQMRAGAGPLQEFLVGPSRTPLLVLLGATVLLLVIACANVGTLLLVRATTREREVVMRRALGASRGRIARQAFIESALLALAGGAVGMALGVMGLRLIARYQPPGLLPVTDLSMDARVVAVVAVACLVCAAVFGAMPALWSAQRPAADALREATRSTSASQRARRWVTALVMAEVALGVMLTVGAGVFVRSYRSLLRLDPGFDPRGVSVVSLTLPGASYESGEQINVFYDALLERVRALPGVEGAALTTVLPLTGGGYTSDFVIRGMGEAGTGREVRHRQVSPDYFRVMKVPLLMGRVFEPGDLRTAEPVVLINRAMAERYFKGRDPIGAFITQDLVPDSASVWRRVVGVVGNERGRDVTAEPGLDMIEPIAQDRSNGFHLMVRSVNAPAVVLPAIQRTITSLDPTIAPSAMRTMEDVRSLAVSRNRFLALMITLFAAVGGVLAIVGVYGVVAHATQRRLPEMGIRLALGAPEAGLRWLVVRQGLILASGGVVLGMAGVAATRGAIVGFVHGVSPMDPFTVGWVTLAVLATAVLAAWLPARRMNRSEVLGQSLRG
ncbi:MAG: ABC transporter permease [Gemmatimonadetes bacterium]|nr:ABC transporter permease [Gemmatimonadota bacterium]